ncbi:N-acetylneuraminate synthase [Natranaerovirga pectinivora]|uniref:N-acetylneuraminate synthase n=1 Tax=Natranaerovirga pectinivora TaxID=682400 RepID=A0A4R3MIM7_9FIRM|nr:N-acetylneuraminate synthase family protein [Natranaerovirga pectinivora]TCT14037.1 N-acetylneuraminate synthase [Natranaerovirga pectinivora]
MERITLDNSRVIGKNEPSYIIVDVAANHNGDLETAKELIREAAIAGVDAVKFQTYEADKLYSIKTPKFSRDSTKPYDLIKSVQHPREWIQILSEYAKKLNIQFLSSPFDYEAVDLLEAINTPLYKVASAEIVDLKLIKYMAQKGKPMIISTGMCNIGEIEDAIEVCREVNNNNIILLQCNTVYPTPPNIVNLNAMDTLKTTFKLPVGFSDHTLGWHVPIAAIAKGASVIEKHFTLSRNQLGPDHSFSIEPDELITMVNQIRDVESALGNGIKKVLPEEMESYNYGRRSIIAGRNIQKGTIITEEMLIIKRPGYGIKPKLMNILIGSKANVDILEDDVITWEMIF